MTTLDVEGSTEVLRTLRRISQLAQLTDSISDPWLLIRHKAKLAYVAKIGLCVARRRAYVRLTRGHQPPETSPYYWGGSPATEAPYSAWLQMIHSTLPEHVTFMNAHAGYGPFPSVVAALAL